jgi:predicted enzyme related to lactoylglutathione lyase
MAKGGICWFEIYVQDMERARHFYEDVLDSRLAKLLDANPELWAFPGAAGALARTAGMPSGGNSTLVYFDCADCAQEAGRVEAAGGRLLRPKFSIGEHGFVALAYDTEGNLFGLRSPR